MKRRGARESTYLPREPEVGDFILCVDEAEVVAHRGEERLANMISVDAYPGSW